MMARKRKTRKKKQVSVLGRWRFTYKLLILNEKTLEEVFHIKLSRFTAFLYFCAALVVVFGLMSALIMFTPIKHFLPGFSDISVRSNLTSEVVKIDSLAYHIRLQDMQMQTMKNIIAGAIPLDTLPKKQDILPEKWAELAAQKSKREQKFIEEYENGEHYYPVVSREKTAVKNKLFSSPVFGEIIEKFDASSSRKGISIAVKTGQRVMAISAGTVIFSSFTLDNGYLVAIQHDNGFISIYKNLSQPLKNTGENIAMGEVIAVVAGIKNSKISPQLLFELWLNGKAVNPEEIMIF
jgi:hypothetical protein